MNRYRMSEEQFRQKQLNLQVLHSVIALLRGKLCEKNIPKICPGKMFSEIVREKYSPNSSFRKSFVHFVVGEVFPRPGANIQKQQICHRQTKTALQKNLCNLNESTPLTAFSCLNHLSFTLCVKYIETILVFFVYRQICIILPV